MNDCSIAIFIARDSQEYAKYSSNGFQHSREKIVCKYRSDSSPKILILDSFEAKEKLAPDEERRNVDAITSFCAYITAVIKQTLEPASDNKVPKGVVVFTHFGSGSDRSIALAEKLLQKTYCSIPALKELFPEWTFLSISSYRKNLFDVTRESITIPTGKAFTDMVKNFTYDWDALDRLKALAILCRAACEYPSKIKKSNFEIAIQPPPVAEDNSIATRFALYPKSVDDEACLTKFNNWLFKAGKNKPTFEEFEKLRELITDKLIN